MDLLKIIRENRTILDKISAKIVPATIVNKKEEDIRYNKA